MIIRPITRCCRIAWIFITSTYLKLISSWNSLNFRKIIIGFTNYCKPLFIIFRQKFAFFDEKSTKYNVLGLFGQKIGPKS